MVPGCPTHQNQNVSYEITYGKQVLANTWSYSLNRDLQVDEQLDFSVYTPEEGDLNGVPGACTQFAETTSPDPKTNLPLLEATCYGVGNLANVSIRSLGLLLEPVTNWLSV